MVGVERVPRRASTLFLSETTCSDMTNLFPYMSSLAVPLLLLLSHATKCERRSRDTDHDDRLHHVLSSYGRIHLPGGE